MTHKSFYQAWDFAKEMIGKDMVLGISSADGSPNILVTGEQRGAMRLGDLRRKDANAYLSLSPIQLSDEAEMRELIRGPLKNNNKQKKRWWTELAESKKEWAAFEHSRALFSMFRGGDPGAFGADSRWSKARFFAFAVNRAKLPGQSVIVDLGYSEIAPEFSVHILNRLTTTRYILRRTLSSSSDAWDLEGEELHITEEELPNKIQDFLNQGSGNSPFVLFVYGSEEAKHVLGKYPWVVFEDGIETLLYPSRQRSETREHHSRDPRRRSASPRRRQRSSSPETKRRSRSPVRIHLIDVKKMARMTSKIHDESPSLRKDAERFGVKNVNPPRANATIDSRTLMELWCRIAAGSHMKAQREGHGLVTTIDSSSTGAVEEKVVSEDPNDFEFSVEIEAPPLDTKAQKYEPGPYEFLSDDDDDDEEDDF